MRCDDGSVNCDDGVDGLIVDFMIVSCVGDDIDLVKSLSSCAVRHSDEPLNEPAGDGDNSVMEKDENEFHKKKTFHTKTRKTVSRSRRRLRLLKTEIKTAK